MLISVQNFAGESPRTSNRLLPENYSTLAENVKLWSGEICPFFNPKATHTPSLTGDIQTIFFFNDTQWLCWNEVVDVVRNPASNNSFKRIYYTGQGAPKKTDSSLIETNTSYLLGVPRPTSTITAAICGTGGTGLDRDVTYTFTYVSNWGEEGSPVIPSNAVTCKSGQKVVISGITSPSSADYPNITKIRIYRSATGNTASSFRFVDEVDITTTSYEDLVPDSALNESLTSNNYTPPPDDLLGLNIHPAGFLVGFRKNEIYMSEPYKPWAWPYGYSYSLNIDIVGLSIVGDSIIVLTREHPYIFSGSHPGVMRRVKFPERMPCLSRRSIATYEGGCIFASPDGLYSIQGENSGQLLTASILTKGDWYKYKPETMSGIIQDQKYYGFYTTSIVDGVASGKAISFDLNEESSRWTEFDIYASGAYVVPDTDTLYLARNINGSNQIQKWEGDASRLSYRWKSKVFAMSPKNPAFAQVVYSSDASLSPEDQETLEISRQEAIARNQVKINNLSFGGSIGDDCFGAITNASSRLEDVGESVSDSSVCVCSNSLYR